MTENSDSDLYDDILCQNRDNNVRDSDIDINDLYDNIHNPEVAETALNKVEVLTSENDRLRKQNSKLKDQITFLQDLNSQLKEKNTILENNIREVIETARTEINRKNTEIIDRQSKLEDVLFRRAARSLTARELTSIMEKFSLREREESFRRLPTKQDQRKVVGTGAGADPCNVANRQVLRKKRTATVQSETEMEQSKKRKTDDSLQKENREQQSVIKEPEKKLNTDISLISNYVKGKERRKKGSPAPAVEQQQNVSTTTESEKHKKIEEKTDRCLNEVNQKDSIEQKETQPCKVSVPAEERDVATVEKAVASQSKVDLVEIVENEPESDSRKQETEDTVSDGYKSGDDLLEIDTNERFDEEEEESPGLASKNVYFKSLETNFSIPKVSNDEKESAKEKNYSISSGEVERRGRGRHSLKESGSGDKEIHQSRGRGRSSSRSRRRRQRSSSRSRRSRSRQRRPAAERRRLSKERGKDRSDRKRRRSTSNTRRTTRSPRSTSRERRTRAHSGERRKRSPKSKSKDLRRQARRSQSLSPSRLKTEEVDIDNLQIEDDLCLGDLTKLKEKIMGQMGLNDQLEPVTKDQEMEDGELLSDEDEGEMEDRSKQIQDLRLKLSNDSNSPVVCKEADTSIDERIPNISEEIKASLQDYSAEDIDKKLIPFKKRQFNELQFEEIKLKKQIEKARSKSNTPRRLSDSSDQLRSSPPLMISTSPPGPSEDLEDKKVSPLKLSLRGVVIQQPSSSSSSNDVMAERRAVTSHTKSDLRQDDNAVFPAAREEEEDNTALDVSQDLTLTDDSDLESSPVKKTKKKQTKILKTPVPKAPKESISFDCLKKFPLTPKENFNIHKVDVSSPKGISELLKSPLISHSLLPTSSHVLKHDENSTSSPIKKRKKKLQLSRSTTATN